MSEDDSSDVRVVDKLIHEADTGVVDNNDGVSALRGDIEDDRIGIVICNLQLVNYNTHTSCGKG